MYLVDKLQQGRRWRPRYLQDTDGQQGMGLEGSQQLHHQAQPMVEEGSSSRLGKAASAQLPLGRCRSRLWSSRRSLGYQHKQGNP